MTLGKVKEVLKQLEEMAEEARQDWVKTACKIATSGSATRAIEDLAEFGDPGNYLFAKAVVDGWCLKRPYAALLKEHQADFETVQRLV